MHPRLHFSHSKCYSHPGPDLFQDGTIVPSDLLSSQKGTPLLVHPMLHPNMGSPRDATTLGEIGSAFPATQGANYLKFIVSSHPR